MAVWGYEFYLLVLKVSLTSSLDFHEKDKIRIPKRSRNILYFYCKQVFVSVDQ